MADQLRYNEGKLQLGYWLSTHASAFIYSGDSWRDNVNGVLTDQQCASQLELALGVFARGDDNEFLLLDEAMECFGSRDALGEAFTRACMMGAAKYERGNYMLGAPISQYIDCAARHLRAIRLAGAWYTESFVKDGAIITQNLNHWDNVAWNIVMIFEVMFSAKELRDDRLFHCGNYAGGKPAPESTVPAFVSALAAAERLAEEAGDSNDPLFDWDDP